MRPKPHPYNHPVIMSYLTFHIILSDPVLHHRHPIHHLDSGFHLYFGQTGKNTPILRYLPNEGAYLSPFNTYKYIIISHIYIFILKHKFIILSYIYKFQNFIYNILCVNLRQLYNFQLINKQNK